MFPLLIVIVQYLISVAAIAACVKAVSNLYAGQNVGIWSSFQEIKSDFLLILFTATAVKLICFIPLIALSLIFVKLGRVAGIILTVTGIVYYFYVLGRYFFAIPVCIVEGRAVRDSLRESALLMRGNYRKAIVVFLGLVLVWAGIGIIVYPFSVIPASYLFFHGPHTTFRAAEEELKPLLNAIIDILAAPLFAIIVPLFYFDARLRREQQGEPILWGVGRIRVT